MKKNDTHDYDDLNDVDLDNMVNSIFLTIFLGE